jgi:hypothetical protein
MSDGAINSATTAVIWALPTPRSWWGYQPNAFEHVGFYDPSSKDAQLSKAMGGIAFDAISTATASTIIKTAKTTGRCSAAENPARILGKGVPDPSGATFRMGRFDPKTGQTVFDDIGHFGQDVKGLSLVEKEGKVFWANDSISSPKILTPNEIRAVESSLRQAFPNAPIQQVKRIKDAF